MVSPPSLGEPDKRLDWLDTWKEMERVYLANKDKVRAIGVRAFVHSYCSTRLTSLTLGTGLQLLRALSRAPVESS